MNHFSEHIENLDNADEKKSRLTKKLFLTQGAKAIPSLEAALNHPNIGVAEEAARTLGMLGKDAACVIPALITAIESDYPNLRAFAAGALGRIAQQPELSIATLTTSLKDPVVHVRQHAVAALSLFGSEAIEAVPDLVDALADGDDVVRDFASSTLREFETVPDAVLSQLSNKFDSPDINIQRHIHRWLAATSKSENFTE